MMRSIAILLATSVLGGCALTPAIDTAQIGDECIRHAYSRNIWYPNWDRVDVLEVDERGHCVKRKEVHTVTARESFGQGAGKAFAGGAPIGIGMGLMRFQQSTNTNLNINETFSTKYYGR